LQSHFVGKKSFHSSIPSNLTYYDNNYEKRTRSGTDMQEWKPQMPYVEQFPVAMAYVPWQRTCTMYENLDEAFKTGTIFPELNKPFLGRRVKG
jgi:hypothetical protein